MMNAIAKPDARDWFNVPGESADHAEHLGESMKGRRIAYSPRLGYAQKVLPEVETLVAAAVKRFEAMGAHVEQVDPSTDDSAEIFQTLWWAGAGFLLQEKLRVACSPARKAVGQTRSRGERKHRDGIGAANARRERGNCCAEHVHVGIAAAHHPPCGFGRDVSRFRFEPAGFLNACAQFPQRAKFRDGEELIRVGGQTKFDQAACSVESNPGCL